MTSLTPEGLLNSFLLAQDTPNNEDFLVVVWGFFLNGFQLSLAFPTKRMARALPS